MSDTKNLELTYTGIAVGSGGVAAVSTVAGALAERNVDHTLVYLWIDDDWSVYKTPKAITSICWPDRSSSETYCLSADGYIVTIYEDGDQNTQIDAADEGPSDLVIMKEMRAIEEEYYVVGMARHAYRSRKPQGKWQPIDKTCFVPRAKRNKAIGFTSIDGFGAQECYAVGYEGEIWVFDGTIWTQELSPANVLLTRVACDRRMGTVWIAGLAGTVIVGRRGQWRILKQTATSNDFWGLEVFGDTVYLSSDGGVYAVDGDDLNVMRLDKRRNYTTSYLATNGAELWSVGDKDIYKTTNGRTWERLPAP